MLLVVFLCFLWYSCAPRGILCSLWYSVAGCGIVVRCGRLWYSVVSRGLLWYSVACCGVLWYPVVPRCAHTPTVGDSPVGDSATGWLGDSAVGDSATGWPGSPPARPPPRESARLALHPGGHRGFNEKARAAGNGAQKQCPGS